MDNNQHMKVVGSMYFCSWHKVDPLDHPPLLKPVGEGGQRQINRLIDRQIYRQIYRQIDNIQIYGVVVRQIDRQRHDHMITIYIFNYLYFYMIASNRITFVRRRKYIFCIDLYFKWYISIYISIYFCFYCCGRV